MNALFHRLTGWHLLEPAWLWLLLLAPLLWMAHARAKPRGVRASLLAVPGLHTLPTSWRARTRHLVPLLGGLSAVAFVLALARPHERVHEPRMASGIDMVLCLDVSSSMDARDLDPQRSRLVLARHAAASFVQARPHDRIGLVTFARYSDLRSPPTLDHDALQDAIEAVRPVAADGPEDATGLGAAVARSAELLASAPAEGRVVVVLTDGEENVAQSGAADAIAPEHAAQLAMQLGVRIYAIAMGGTGASPRGRAASAGAGTLQAMARQTKGAFMLATDAGSLRGVYETIDALERTAAPASVLRIQDRGLPFIVVGLGLLLVAHLLRATWGRVQP